MKLVKKHNLLFINFSILLLIVGVVIACSPVNPTNWSTSGDRDHLTFSEVDLAIGIVPGVTNGRIIAQNANLGNTPEDIWDGTGNLNWPETADTIELVSTSTSDDSGGIGALTILVTGLDVSFNPLQEIVILDGLTPVDTVNEFIRVNQILVTSVGQYEGSNVGLITATHNGNSAEQALIQIAKGISQKSHFTVPNGHFIVFRNVTVGSDSSRVATYEFLVRTNTTIPPVAPFFSVIEPVTLAGVAGSTEMRILNGREVPERSDVWVQGSVSPPGGFVSLGIDFILVNTDISQGLGAQTQCEIAC